MKKLKKACVGASALLMVLSLAGCGSQQSSSASASSLNYHSGEKAYKVIHHNKSTLNPHSWKYDHIIYTKLDHLNRTSKGNTAYLDKNNVVGDSQRVRQNVKPTGWHQKFDSNGQAIINRGHEIAYSLSRGINKKGQYKPNQSTGDQDNVRNLFTQTAFSNQKVQTIYESQVRNALRKNYHVIYKVQPIFKGHDLMAKGVHMQAVSTNKKLNFNIYLYNVQPGFKFNYLTGRSVVDRNMHVPTPANAPHFNNDSGNGNYSNKWSQRSKWHYNPRRHRWVKGYIAYRGAKWLMRHHRRHEYYKHYSYYPKYHRFHHYHRW